MSWVNKMCIRDSPEAGKVNLLFCKGPDEYCGITSNNLFTNAMVKHNLSLALTAAARLKKEAPEQYAACLLYTSVFLRLRHRPLHFLLAVPVVGGDPRLSLIHISAWYF